MEKERPTLKKRSGRLSSGDISGFSDQDETGSYL